MDYLKIKMATDAPPAKSDKITEGKCKKRMSEANILGMKEDTEIPVEQTYLTNKDEKADGFERKTEFTIKLRGLPFHAKKKDIEVFLSPLNAVDIRMPKDNKNRPSGRAYVDLESQESVKEALKRHKDYIKGRYIEVFEDKRHEVLQDPIEDELPWMENARELAENKDLSIAEVIFE